MKKSLSVAFIFISFWSLAQPKSDSLNWDRTLDGVHKKSSCNVDTLVTFYTKKNLVVKDTVNYAYSFEEGKRSYIEIRIRTTICWCTDCSYADHIIIDVTDLKAGDKVNLNQKNSQWIIWNSMMIAHNESTFAGSLDYNGSSDFQLEIYKYVMGQSWLTYDGIKVVKN